MVECQVCVDTTHFVLKCPQCLFVSCETCLKKYWKENPLNLKCLSCSFPFSNSFLTTHLSKGLINSICKNRTILRNHKNDFKNEMHKELKSLRKQKKDIEAKIKILKSRILKTSTNLYFCSNRSCGQQLGEESVCAFCQTETNTKDQPFIQNCPSCCVPIERSDGCPQMFCTHCHVGFDWNSLEILSSTNNPHYWKYQIEKRQRFQHLSPTEKIKWTHFQELLESSKKKAVLYQKTGRTERQKWSYEVFSYCLETFYKEGQELVNSTDLPDFNTEYKMYEIMKKFNDHILELGDKLKTKPPRIIGWKLVDSEK